ncbi:MAG: lipase maturation factor family protein, partial [Terriglobia bacterium]
MSATEGGRDAKKPLLVYDGECGFCRFAIEYWTKLTRDQVAYAPFQKVAANFPEMPIERFQRSAQLIEPEGRVSSAAEAVFRVLSYGAAGGWLLWCYEHVPGFAPASEGAYRGVARHRPLCDRLRLLLWDRTLDPPTHFLPRWIFLRLLGIAYLAAFASLWPQIAGLAGVHGILPAQTFLASVAHSMGPERYCLLPTLAWLNASDGFLKFLAEGGAALSIALILGIAPGPVLVALWVFYLSLVTAGQDFMVFQWDILLLEAGFLAIFIAPWSGLAGHWRTPGFAARPPSKVIVWLLRWLLFRLMFLSGCVKLLSGDPTWRNLTALEYHYHTQPLPTPLAWYAAQLPAWFQKCSVAGVFVIEIGVPFLIFAPRRIRFIGCAVLAAFQVLIALTGNYAFFNLLAITLCVM